MVFHPFAKFDKLLIPAGLFLLAFVLRVTALGVFLTTDEHLWINRSYNFLASFNPAHTCYSEREGTRSTGLACTPRPGHPGVTTMWTGSLGLLYYYFTRPPVDHRSLSQFLADSAVFQASVDPRLIAPVRWPTALLSSLLVAGVYTLVAHLFDRRVGLLAGLLLALSPFHLALSRVLHHDALVTAFMTPAALSMGLYFGLKRSRRWLVMSGVLAGLALVTKTVALFLIPYVGLIGSWAALAAWARGEQPFRALLRRTLIDWLIWGGIVGGIVFSSWPALWVIPRLALVSVFETSFNYSQEGHDRWGVFFWGQTAPDPGPLFYPVTWLFRTTPWTMVGLGLALCKGWQVWRRDLGAKPDLRTLLDRFSPGGSTDRPGLLLWLVAYIFFFILFLNLSAKKQDRYALPIYPMFEILAAVGLTYLPALLAGWLQALRLTQRPRLNQLNHFFSAGLLWLVLASQLALTLSVFPYYFSYYNPLLGGPTIAARVIPVGWGEGMNEVAAYLNQKPEADDLVVSAWYGSTLAPFFEGRTDNLSEQQGYALGGDYVVFYINQLQRRIHWELWRYFDSHYPREMELRLNGLPYAWVYPGPAIAHYGSGIYYPGQATWLGWGWQTQPNPDEGPALAGAEFPFALYWEYLGKPAGLPFFFRLLDLDGRLWTEAFSQPEPGSGPVTTWGQGKIIKETGILAVPGQTPPGIYELQIGFAPEPETRNDKPETPSVSAPPLSTVHRLPSTVIIVSRKLVVLPLGCRGRFEQEHFQVLAIPHDPLLEAQMQERAGQAEALNILLQQAGVIDPALSEPALFSSLTNAANLVATRPARANDFWSSLSLTAIPVELRPAWLEQGGVARSLQKAVAGFELSTADLAALRALAEYFQCSAPAAGD